MSFERAEMMRKFNTAYGSPVFSIASMLRELDIFWGKEPIMTKPTVYLDYDRVVDEAARGYGTIPHCDSNILHRPESCAYCDLYTDLHAARQRLGINYTGEHDPDKWICPSERNRPLMDIERWHGNLRRQYDGNNPPCHEDSCDES